MKTDLEFKLKYNSKDGMWTIYTEDGSYYKLDDDLSNLNHIIKFCLRKIQESLNLMEMKIKSI